MTVVVSKLPTDDRPEASIVVCEEQSNVITVCREVDTYRGAAEICGVDPKTIKKPVERDQVAFARVSRRRNYEDVRALVAGKVDSTRGKISAKR